MCAQLALAPVFDAWHSFEDASGIRHIENNKDYDEVTALADALVDDGAVEEGHPQHSLFLVLTDLIYAYDRRHYPQLAVRGVDMLRFLMEQHGLKQKPATGDRSPECCIGHTLR
jgi:HTH-type transcriptional regulator/antitoxin HigA